MLVGGISFVSYVLVVDLLTNGKNTVTPDNDIKSLYLNIGNSELLMISVGLIFTILGFLSLLTAFGLYKNRRWGIYLGIVLSLSGFIISIYGLSNDKNYYLVFTIISAIVTGYLSIKLI